jgi:hypothetical protein
MLGGIVNGIGGFAPKCKEGEFQMHSPVVAKRYLLVY